MRLLSPEIDFFLKDGDRVHMTADKGVLNTKTNDIRARGNVRVHDSRYTLVTETLSYEHDTRVLHSKSPVQIKSATMSLKAKEVWYNLNTQQAPFSGNVQGELDEEFAL